MLTHTHTFSASKEKNSLIIAVFESIFLAISFAQSVYLESIGAGAAVVVHRVIGAGAIVLAGVGQAGLTLSLDTHIYWTCVMQTHTQNIHNRETISFI